jgi:hypothetical protein
MLGRLAPIGGVLVFREHLNTNSTSEDTGFAADRTHLQHKTFMILARRQSKFLPSNLHRWRL